MTDTDPNVRHVVQPASDLAPAICSKVHVVKCIMNLVTNAVESIPDEGRVLLATWNETLNDETAKTYGLQPGCYAVIGVSDTGSGIAAKDIPHIFEPFYTRKVMGKSGSGLGLTVVWNSMVDHEGTVRVDSGPKGTTFQLFFPATSPTTACHQPPQDMEAPKGNLETILVVDDDPLQREIAEHILCALHYQAVCVESGEKALAYIEAHSIDLVLLDMVMDPGINGYETYRRMIAIRPGIKAIVASGFSGSQEVRNTLNLGASDFIAKPYSMETLGKALKANLGK